MYVFNELSNLKWLAKRKGINSIEYKRELIGWFNEALMENNIQLVVVFTIIVLVIILFQSERKNETYSLIASMPFKREEIIKTKWVVGSLSVFISFFITFIMLSVFYFLNTEFIKNSYNIVLKWTLINILTYIAIFTILLFGQTFIGQNIVGGIVSSISLIVPFGAISMIEEIVAINMNLNGNHKFIIGIDKFAKYLNIYGINSAEYVLVDKGASYYVYNNYFIKLGVLVILITIFYNLAVYTYKKNKFENNGNIIMFSFFEPVFKWGITICSGLFLAFITMNIIYGFEQNKIIIDIFLVIGCVIGYFISDKMVLIFSK
jgi:ABC-type transport system involved in multi-copper enzyme maturation permease subunit